MKSLILFIISLVGLIVSVVLYLPDLNTGTTKDVILLISILICFISVITFSILSIRNFYARSNKVLKKRLDMWTNISYHINQVGDEVINELPVGILVIDDVFEVKWVNKFAKDIFGPNLIGYNLFEVSKDFLELNQKANFLVKTKSHKYDCVYKKDNKSLYLFDVTKREEITLKFIGSIPAFGIVSFDNLDEALSGLDFSAQSAIKAEYFQAISDWSEKFESLLRPLNEERLILITNRGKLSQMCDDKFSVLDRVRELSKKHSLRVSISVGVASWDLSYEELGDYAQNAVELAEKRGGDQAVVNVENQKIEFFGGRTDALFKSSKVIVRINAQELRELIEGSSNVFIMGHINADADAFGAMLIVNRMVKSYGIKSHMILDEDRVDKTVRLMIDKIQDVDRMVLADSLTTAETLKKINAESLLVVVDTQNPKLVHSPELLEKIKRVAVLDHHRTGDDVINASYSYIETAASSSVELCLELMQFVNKDIEITPIEATIMYAGLIIDTADFTSRTSPRTFEVAGKLFELEADAAVVKTLLRKDLDRTLEINRLLDKMEIYQKRFAIVHTEEVIEDRVFLAQVSSAMLDIDGLDAAFTIARLSDTEVGVSARSIPPVNVQLLMEQLGGGGHLQSAAAQVKNRTVDEVYEDVKRLIDIESKGGEAETMKVILITEVKGKGLIGDVIEVANGYGQFLISSKQAILASNANLKDLENKKLAEEEAIEKHKEIMKKLQSEIDGKSITLGIQIGKDEKLFGAVTTKQIVEEFENEFGIKLDKKKVTLSSDINSLGIYSATVDLYKGIKAQFEVSIVEK